MQFVANWWESPFWKDAISTYFTSINPSKVVLNVGTKYVFLNIFHNIYNCEDQIKSLQSYLDNDGPQDNISIFLDQKRKKYENLLS